MGFLNSLITGATVAGKIGQALISAYAKQATLSDGSKVVMAD